MRAQIVVVVFKVHILEQAERGRIVAGTGTAGHQHVDTPEACRDAIRHGLHLPRVEQVRRFETGAAARRFDLRHHGRARLRIATADHHGGALFGQPDRAGAADECRRARDHRHLVFQFQGVHLQVLPAGDEPLSGTG